MYLFLGPSLPRGHQPPLGVFSGCWAIEGYWPNRVLAKVSKRDSCAAGRSTVQQMPDTVPYLSEGQALSAAEAKLCPGLALPPMSKSLVGVWLHLLLL